MDDVQFVNQIIDRARKAQKIFESYTQEQVDEVVRAVGKAVYDNGEELARMAIDETHMGNYDDKVLKNKGKAMAVWNYLKGKKSVGILQYFEDEGIDFDHEEFVIQCPLESWHVFEFLDDTAVRTCRPGSGPVGDDNGPGRPR